MLTADAVAFFGSKANIARALNQTTGRITQWGPVVHESSASKIHVISGGAVVYDPEFYQALKKNPDHWQKANPRNAQNKESTKNKNEFANQIGGGEAA